MNKINLDDKLIDIRCEEWREYISATGHEYTIYQPVSVYIKVGSTAHRVLDSRGVYHYIDLVVYPIFRWKGDLVA